MKLLAVIFDLNGTILSDEDEYGMAFNIVLKRLGVESNSKFPHVTGIGVQENWPLFIKKFNIKTAKTINQLTTETQNEYLKMLKRVKLKKGFVNFMKKLRKRDIKTALATSNSWSVVEKVFDKFAIENLFDSVTTGEEVSFKKPDPEIFLKTADKIQINPRNCLVIEDSASGIKAARKAGMKVVGIARNKKYYTDLNQADILVKDFSMLSLESITKI